MPPGEFEKPELLQLEKETLGLYVSEHPLHAVRDQLRRKTDCTLAELERRRDGEVVTVGGIVSALKQLTTKKGEPMVFLTLDDPTGGGEVVVFNSTYATARDLCVTERILVIKGRVDHKQQGETKLLAMEVTAFEAVPERTEIRLRLDARQARAGIVKELVELVQEYPGDSPVFVSLETSMGPKTLALGPKLPRHDRLGLPHRRPAAARRGRRSLILAQVRVAHPPRPFSRSSASAESLFWSSSPIPRRISGVFVNWMSA